MTSAERARERLIAVQLEHETIYNQQLNGRWTWKCRCGDYADLFQWEDCHKRTREHWADVIIALLTDIRLEEAKQAAKSICDDCNAGIPFDEKENRFLDGKMYHWREGGFYNRCFATPIQKHIAALEAERKKAPEPSGREE